MRLLWNPKENLC